MASETAVTQAQQHAADLVGWIDRAAAARMPLRIAGLVAAAAMLVATASYWRRERLQLGGLSWAKWSFVGSLLALYVAL